MENVKKNSGFSFLGLMFFMVMIFAYANPHFAQAAVDSIKVATYAQDLEILDINPKATGKSIIVAKDLYFKTFTEQDSQETRDAAFIIFEKFYENIAEKVYKDEVFEQLYSISYVEKDPYFLTATKEAESYGLQLVQLEGDFYPVANSNYLVKTFGKLISPAIRAYLTFKKKNEHIVEDAALMVSVDELREIIILGDTVVKKYPDSDIATLIKPILNQLLDFYILGVNNLPISDGSTKEMDPALKSSFSKFLKENTDSTYYPLIKYVYNYLQKNKFRYTDKVSTALSEKLREDGLSDW